MDPECSKHILEAREYIDLKIALTDSKLHDWADAHRREHELQQAAGATVYADIVRRLEDIGTIRQAVDRLPGQYISLATYEAKHETLGNRVADLDERINQRISTMETRYNERFSLGEAFIANMSGRFWALGVGLTVMVFIVNVALRFVGR